MHPVKNNFFFHRVDQRIDLFPSKPLLPHKAPFIPWRALYSISLFPFFPPLFVTLSSLFCLPELSRRRRQTEREGEEDSVDLTSLSLSYLSVRELTFFFREILVRGCVLFVLMISLSLIYAHAVRYDDAAAEELIQRQRRCRTGIRDSRVPSVGPERFFYWRLTSRGLYIKIPGVSLVAVEPINRI